MKPHVVHTAPDAPAVRPGARRALDPFAALGRWCLGVLGEMGALTIFFGQGVSQSCVSTKQIPRILHEVHFIGVKSMFVIALIGLFTGMVLGLQGYYTLVKFGSEGLLGAAVALSLIRELGPVLTAIMITGRAGSSMAAEIGVMRITDQIDALEVMDVPPMRRLIGPKILASFICFPLLTALFDVIGILGGWLTGVRLLGINQGVFFSRIESSVEMADVSGGFWKSLVFAAGVSAICCFMGYFTHHRRDGFGPEGVSNAATAAVVASCVFVLVSDYVVTSIIL